MLYSVEKVLPQNYTVSDVIELNELLTNANNVHQMLAKLFAATNANWRANAGILYKALPGGRWLVRSKEKPLSLPGIKVTEQPEPKIADGEMLVLEVTAAPFKKQGQNKRTIIANPAARIEWLTNKMSHNNECTVLEINEAAPVNTYMAHNNIARGVTALTGYIYRLKIKVNSASAVRGLIENGIGPSKSYGFGLIEVIASVTHH